MTELLDLVRDMFLVGVTVLVPLLVAGVLGAFVGGLVVAYLGLQDQSIAALTRGAAVVLALLVTGVSIAGQVKQFTGDAWSGLAALGREPLARLPDSQP